MSPLHLCVGLLILVGTCTGKPQAIPLPHTPESALLLQGLWNAVKECSDEAGLSFEYVKKVHKEGPLDVPKDVKCAKKCFMQATVYGQKMMDENGNIIISEAMETYAPGFRKCVETIDDVDLCDKAWAVFSKCRSYVVKFENTLMLEPEPL